METTRNSNLANELIINYLVAVFGTAPNLPLSKSGILLSYATAILNLLRKIFT